MVHSQKQPLPLSRYLKLNIKHTITRRNKLYFIIFLLKKKSAYRPLVAYQAKAYPGLSSTKPNGVFLLPPGWDAVVHHRVTLTFKFASTHFYYMASSATGQDEPNRALWLATRAGKMEPPSPLGTTRCIPQAKFPQKPYNKSFIDQVCSVKMAEYWPRSFFAGLWTSTSSWSINTQKKNLANIQPSWPHTWSITHTYT